MTTPETPAARKARTLRWLSTLCLGVAVAGAVVAAALGLQVSLSLWLMLGGASAGFASVVVEPARPKAGQWLVYLAAALTVAAIVVMVGWDL